MPNPLGPWTCPTPLGLGHAQPPWALDIPNRALDIPTGTHFGALLGVGPRCYPLWGAYWYVHLQHTTVTRCVPPSGSVDLDRLPQSSIRCLIPRISHLTADPPIARPKGIAAMANPQMGPKMGPKLKWAPKWAPNWVKWAPNRPQMGPIPNLDQT